MLKIRNVLKVFKRDFQSTKIGILGVPFGKGQQKDGVSEAPEVLRNANLVKRLKSIDPSYDVKDFGDAEHKLETEKQDLPNITNYPYFAACTKQVSIMVEKIMKEGRVCLTLGGDHSIAVGTVDGHLKAKNNNLCLLWIDAHSDLNTYKTTPSNNSHGMPAAFLIKEMATYWPKLPSLAWRNPGLPAENLAYLGLRAVDSFEKLAIEKLGIAHFDMEEIDNLGIKKVIETALDCIDPAKNKSIHVSFDIDVLDELEAPSTGTSSRGGLTLREAILIMEVVARTGRLGAVDLVEVNPRIGSREDVKKTVNAAIHIIEAAFGHRRSGKSPKDVREIPK